LPAPLVALFVGMLLANGLRITSIQYINMEAGLPTLYWPDVSLFSSALAPAFALAGLCAFDSLLTCLVCDAMTEDRHDSNRELFGQGIANMFCGIVGGVTTATATMRSVVNIKCGAKSSLSCITMGVVMLALMLGLGPFARYVPMACLAGILMKVGIDILDYRVLPVLRRLPLSDMLCFWAVLGLTLWADLLVAVGVGLAIAFARFVMEMSKTYGPEVVSLKDDDRPWQGEEDLSDEFRESVLTLHQEGPMFFGLSDAVYRTMERVVHYDVLIIRLGRVRYMDLSGAYLLEDLVEKAQSLDTRVLVTGMNAHVRNLMERVKVLKRIGEENLFDRYEDAVACAHELHRNGNLKNGNGDGGAVSRDEAPLQPAV
jgi:SulP family sulfate permease